jgi:hypothetical protein
MAVSHKLCGPLMVFSAMCQSDGCPIFSRKPMGWMGLMGPMGLIGPEPNGPPLVGVGQRTFVISEVDENQRCVPPVT